MENNFYTEDFEQLLKEKADQFRMYPSRRVWHSIYNNLHPSRRWPSFAMSILLITSLLLIGYLNTSDNTVGFKFTDNALTQPSSNISTYIMSGSPAANSSAIAGENISSLQQKKSNPVDAAGSAGNPRYDKTVAVLPSGNNYASGYVKDNSDISLIQSVDSYINSNRLFSDVALTNKNNLKPVTSEQDDIIEEKDLSDKNEQVFNTTDNEIVFSKKVSSEEALSDFSKLKGEEKNSGTKTTVSAEDLSLSPEEKAWMENYAQLNRPPAKKWKDRLAVEFYVTPAVNYRKLTTESKGSTTPFATTGDINRSISQKPGLGLETGVGLAYAFAKNLRFKAGVQFNYTNYNINADQNNHPVLTTILLNDPSTGYSYASARSSTLSNPYKTNALQPVTLHNRTYQVSVPVGLAYKVSSNNNVEWFVGATFQPSYIFGGNAHLISADLKSYVSDPSTIRHWNFNLGFETYMNYKLGAYNLQVGPQFRYQIYSTYRKDVALIEKPYAIGLKIGVVKGF